MSAVRNEAFNIALNPKVREDEVWREKIVPLVDGVASNVVDICQYGFTEILNNAIDHSGSPDAFISYKQTDTSIEMIISDDGVGIFAKIQKDFGLSDPREALLELSKGKLTSDQTRHSGEGIFFVSRMFDMFLIHSGRLAYRKTRSDGDEWLIETENLTEDREGTSVHMRISTTADWTTKEVFDKYQDDDYGFSKTHVPIGLVKYGTEQLVSRSQAKRVLARFEKFSEVSLDFQGVESIGQAFSDEIFRVFPKQHPNVRISTFNTTPEVARMIARAQNAANAEN